jgi:ATP-binding cassette, subfamily B, bacterial PglK
VIDSIRKLLHLFEKKEKKQLLLLFLMMIFAAIFETIGIGLIVPFVGIVTNPNIIQEQAFLAYIFKVFNFQSQTSFITFSVVILLLVFILKNLYLLFFHYVQCKLILNQQVKLSRQLFEEYLKKPYLFHLQRNSAELLRNVNEEVSKVFQGIIMSGFHLLTEMLVIFCILVLLIITSPEATIFASIILVGSVLIFFKFFRKRITFLGKENQKVSAEMIKWVNQGLGASKEVKVSGKESFFVEAYSKHSQVKANNSRYMKMLEQIPRLFIETLLVVVVLFTMLYIILQEKNTSQLIATMALFSMAAFRLLPSINRVVTMITTIRYCIPSLSLVYKDLFKNREQSSNENLPSTYTNNLIDKRIYNDCILLKEVSFRYPNQDEYTVKGVSLNIPIGQSVAIIGDSGAGKTTLVDIILGLLRPEKGSILVDGKDLYEQKYLWQQRIGYIPQNIFLTDDSIRNNVAFGIKNEDIDDTEVWRALEQAKLKEFVANLPDKLETVVGERGVRLSGGQRQRIGIARALYHNPEILFMDEATSALDNETEKEIMREFDGLKGEKTLIIIAHRLSTIENCDTVFRLKQGKIISIYNNVEQTS